MNDRPVRVLKGFASADGAEKAWRNQLWNCLKNDSEWIVRKCIKPNLCEIERDDWIELVKQEQWDDVDEIVKIVDTHFSGRSEHMSSPFVQCNNCDSAILNPIYLFEIPVENLSHESYRCKCENPADHYIL